MNDAEIIKTEPLAVGRPIEPEAQRSAGAQARVDAVAELIKTAMARAGTLVLTPEESKALLADFPDSDFQPGAGGKENLLYIEHAALRDRFNTVLGLGQWAIIVRESWNENFKTAKGQDAVKVYARAMLLVRGCYVGEAVGDMDYFTGNASQNYGDAFEGAKTAAFRRCAKEFGIGLQAWRKGFGDGWRERKYAQREQQQLRPEPAPAKTNGNGSTHADRIASFAKWLYEQCGAEVAGWAIPYLRSHTPDGGEASSALMPSEGLTELSENSLAAIRKDMAGFLERLKAFAEQNKPEQKPLPSDFLPMEGEKLAIGEITAVTIKEGTTNKKRWVLYEIQMPGDFHLVTFSKSVGEAAKGAQGKEATIFYLQDDKGNTATAIKTADGLTRAGESKDK